MTMEAELRMHRIHGLHPGAAPAKFLSEDRVVLTWGVGQTYKQARAWARMANARYETPFSTRIGDINYRFPMREVRHVGRS